MLNIDKGDCMNLLKAQLENIMGEYRTDFRQGLSTTDQTGTLPNTGNIL